MPSNIARRQLVELCVYSKRQSQKEITQNCSKQGYDSNHEAKEMKITKNHEPPHLNFSSSVKDTNDLKVPIALRN